MVIIFDHSNRKETNMKITTEMGCSDGKPDCILFEKYKRLQFCSRKNADQHKQSVMGCPRRSLELLLIERKAESLLKSCHREATL